MSKNYLVASVILGLVLAGAIVWNIFGKRFPSASSKMPKEVTVTLRDDGFDPSNLTIEEGTAVRWVNNTTSPQASINSDDYPTNKRFPELNLGRFEQGQSLVYIFTKKGMYSYHDHFNAEHTGTVEVK